MASLPPPSHQPKPLFDLELTIVSAKHLKNVNWRNGDLKPYAVAYLDPDRRSATKPDDSGASTSPVWNERLSLSLPLSSLPSSLTLTLDIFHSKPSETPKPLVATARIPLSDLLDFDNPLAAAAGPNPIKTLVLRRPSGRPQGKLRIKIALRERPLPPPPPPTHSHPIPEQNYQIAPHPPPAYYYSTPPRDYRTFSPPPPPYYPYYDSYGSGYYSAPPVPAPAPAPVASRMYYDRPGGYGGGPSAPVDYSSSSYEVSKKEGRTGMGAGLAVGVVAGAMGGLALGEGIKYEEEKVKERVENDMASRDDYSDYRGDY